MDNCSAHGNHHSLSELSNVKVYFLPPNSTSSLQPLDAAIIASMKMQYGRRHMERAVDLSDVGVKDIHKVEILTAMNWMSEVWTEVTNETIPNGWRTTRLMVEGP